MNIKVIDYICETMIIFVDLNINTYYLTPFTFMCKVSLFVNEYFYTSIFQQKFMVIFSTS